MNIAVLETIPTFRIINGYYKYVATFYLNAANTIQRQIGVENLPNGLTPDIVKFNPEYRQNIHKMNAVNKIAKKNIPAAKELRKIIREYHNLYNTGQRIKIMNHIDGVIDTLISLSKDEILPYSFYETAIKEAFKNFEV